MKKEVILRYKARFDCDKNYHYIGKLADNMVFLYQRNRLKNNGNYDNQNIAYKRYTGKDFNNSIASEDLKSVVLTSLLELNKLGYFYTENVTFTAHKTTYNRENKTITSDYYNDLTTFTVSKNISTSNITELQLICDDIEVVKIYADGTTIHDTFTIFQYCFSVLNDYLNHEKYENPVSLYETDDNGNLYSIFDVKTVAQQVNVFDVSHVSRDNVILQSIDKCKYKDEIYTYISKKVEGLTDVKICQVCGWTPDHTRTIKSHVYKVYKDTCKRDFKKVLPSVNSCPVDYNATNDNATLLLMHLFTHSKNTVYDTTDRQTDRTKEAQRVATLKSNNEKRFADFEKCNDSLLMSTGVFNDIATTQDYRRYLTVTEKTYPYM